MATDLPSFRRILCPVDFSDPSRRALARALAVAKLYDGRVTIMHVASVGAAVAAVPARYLPQSGDLCAPDFDAITGDLVRFAALGPADTRRVEFRATSGVTWRAIVDEAARGLANMIVLARHGRSGVERWLIGSVASRVVQRAPCPVLVVPATDRPDVVGAAGTFTRILCGVDFSDASMRALGCATSMARRSRAPLLVMHVLESPETPPGAPDVHVEDFWAEYRGQICRRLLGAIPDAAGLQRSAAAVIGSSARAAILNSADIEFADLVVVGRSGRGAAARWVFGSTAEHLVRSSPCPVLAVPSPDEEVM